jgi:hypothetical protein
MKQFLIIVFLVFLGTDSYSQVVQVNPNIKWTYVRSQDLSLENNSVYQFEFPAEKGYDYGFNLDHNKVSVLSTLKIYDMQYKPIAASNDTTAGVVNDMYFRVPSSGTYYVVISYKSKEVPKLESNFTLIRRPIVDP